MAKKTPFYSGGSNPTVTPHFSPVESGTTAWPAVLPLPLAVLPCSLGGLAREQELDPMRYCHGGRAVLPLMSGTTALLPLLSAAQSDTRNDPLESTR